MKVHPITFYKKDATGTLRFWTISCAGFTITMEHGIWGGTSQKKDEKVLEGKGGRSVGEQMLSRIDSRVSKQKDKGYVYDIEKAKDAGVSVNAAGTPRPMLAQPLKNVTLPENYFLQYKYDGNRCLITKQNGVVFAYSRNGKPMDSIDHILEAAASIPEGCILDGELYHHGTPLQTIRSWIAKKQADSNNLVYMLYDTMLPEPFKNRLGAIRALNLPYPITLARTREVGPENRIVSDIYEELKEAIELGYEGLIARTGDSGYEAGKRSKSLIKIKAWEDSEFVVQDISASADGWAILHMDSKSGKRFKASAPGSIEQKENTLKLKDEHIGQTVTIQYAYMTKDGVPFHPTAVAWRYGGE